MDRNKPKYKVLAQLLILPIVTLGTILTLDLLILPSSGPVFAQDGEKTSSPDGQRIVKQGIGTSSPDPLPGHQAHQSITILRLSPDNTVYSGRVTFTTTQPVEVQILHRSMANTTYNIPENFGKLTILQLPDNNGQVIITNVVPKFTEGATGTTFAASVPFSGNAVALHNLEGKPFAASYTVTADILGPAERVDDVEG
jgi:hypothetical protein